MAKKRILFTIQSLSLGGAERALIGLLSSIDYDRYDVDLFLVKHQGELLELIPPQVNLLAEIPQYSHISATTVQLIKKGYWGIALVRKFPRLQSWLFGMRLGRGVHNHSFKHYQLKYLMPFLPTINPDTEYDLAVGFLSPFHLVSRKVRAKCRAAWLHEDYTKLGINPRSEIEYMDNIDHFVSISEMVSAGFISRFPSLADKVVRIDHVISKDFIVAQSHLKDVSEQMTGEVRLCTVGRLTYEKNLINAVKMCSILVSHKPNTYWYVVGGDTPYSNYREQVVAEIERLGMQHHFILLGQRTNPYPYMAHCHIYVQPSLFEAKSIAVIEAQMLGKPTIITNYTTAQNQLRDGIDGVIVPMDTQAAAHSILDVIQNRELRQMLHENCAATNYSNSDDTDKFYALIP